MLTRGLRPAAVLCHGLYAVRCTLSRMVELQPYQASWADEFTREAAAISYALAGLVTEVEHIGSTAVPDMIAKPIIDIAARSEVSADPFDLGSTLDRIGYRHHTTGPRTHAVYIRADGTRRTHILHVFAADQWANCNQRVFRDKLLRDVSARQRYRDLKQSLAPLRDGREYTAAKLSLIEELLNEERARRGLPSAMAWDK
jgi:GrpB-like predicted nucleotidyltransferase (UPF0157 family)